MVRLNYKLSREQAENGLCLCEIINPQKRKKINIIEISVLSVLLLLTIISIFMNPSNEQNYYIAAAIVFASVMILAFTGKGDNDLIERAANGYTVSLTADSENEKIDVFISETDSRWTINKENYIKHYENDELFGVLLKGDKIMIIPKTQLNADEIKEFSDIFEAFNKTEQEITTEKSGEEIE